MGVPKILIVEDTKALADVVQRGLNEAGYEAHVACTGEVAFRRLGEAWDLVILDLMLPDVSGEEILSFINQDPDGPRVLILTARSRMDDKIALFRQGCDDYLTKPFVFDELLGRVKALLRRASHPIADHIEYEGLSLDAERHVLMERGVEVTLTPKEFAICRLLMSEPGRLVSRKELLRSVWGLTHEQRTNFVEVHLANLRKKLAQIDRQDWLHTVRATGVTLQKPDSRAH